MRIMPEVPFVLKPGVELHTFNDQPKGAWIVYSYDTNAYPIALFDNELGALRRCVDLGYGKVKFWEFGTDWSNND